jgi:hypothetical protein
MTAEALKNPLPHLADMPDGAAFNATIIASVSDEC